GEISAASSRRAGRRSRRASVRIASAEDRSPLSRSFAERCLHEEIAEELNHLVVFEGERGVPDRELEDPPRGQAARLEVLEKPDARVTGDLEGGVDEALPVASEVEVHHVDMGRVGDDLYLGERGQAGGDGAGLLDVGGDLFEAGEHALPGGEDI